MVQQAPSRQVDEGVAELRRLEQDRLDALQASLWDRALAGDLRAIRATLRIIEGRCRLLGLHVSDRAHLFESQPSRLVVAGTAPAV